MRLHPYLTVRILNRVNGLGRRWRRSPYNHHECMNATGYPRNLPGAALGMPTGCWPPR